ncbi:MAG: hypothetical protein NAG76_15685 [Candidatus Pristimantibacillus lignocellulolyticus]|uniref:Periplasmic protein n=1 Tax=Candidatus Pristimantibacillus lignocellulolyticus TaxID=2994561 RepID=A0A9J6ZBF1_9BACL|nr:MAG: hypothetical protein NAG76_15685 [Candidatus Pristimantibacillus lignocellulolyticus]
MREKRTRRWSTYETFYIELGTKKVADIHITTHAEKRWKERVTLSSSGMQHIADYMWESLRRSAIRMYYQGEEEAYIIDDDLVFIADFTESDHDRDLLGNPLHRMHIITFLGHISEVVQLQDLKSYYTWLRHNRKMNLLKNRRTMR